MAPENYLAIELSQLFRHDKTTWTFLQQGSLDGVWYWDLENPDHEWMSSEFWKTFGIDPKTKRHDPAEWQDIIFQDDLKVALRNFEAHCADPSHPYDQIVRYRHADGSTVWIRCRGIAIRDKSGKPVRMLGAHTDITAVKRSEESARAGWRAAELANSELKSFAYSVSHDMKAPANTLKLLLDELQTQVGDTLDADCQDIIAMSQQTVTRMQGLVEDVLDYTRIIGEQPVFQTVDLGQCAESAVQDLTSAIRTSNATVTMDSLPTVHGIRSQLNVLFQNLIANSIKFAKPDVPPDIRITHTRDFDTDTHVLAVRDNGIGIADHNKDRIFNMFQRLHGHDEVPGTGLGLAICQRIVTNHRGTLTVDSTLGNGATFTITLPWKS